MGVTVRRFMGESLDQGELFGEVDSTGSVSALSRGRGELTHISLIEPVRSLVDDGLPF